MLSLFKNRAVVVALGLVLLALFIWFAGPYFAFADHRPLESTFARLVTILVIVVAYAGYIQYRQLTVTSSSRALADEVARVSDDEGGRAGNADAAQLRKRFEEAMETLKRSRKRRGASLYELPWYI